MTIFILVGALAALALLALFVAKQIAERKRRERRLARDERNREIERDWQAYVGRNRAEPTDPG